MVVTHDVHLLIYLDCMYSASAVIMYVIATHESGMVIHSVTYVCVCPVKDLTFESIDLETSL